MIRRVWLRAIRFLGSALCATWLLAAVGIWSSVATLIPQAALTSKVVTAWASAHPILEVLVRALGLHQAFTSAGFMVLVLALGSSTALCAWRRTKVAISRARTLGQAARADAPSVSAAHDLEIVCGHDVDRSDVLSITAEALRPLGIKAKRRGDLLSAVSPGWSTWGSPVFHWGLLVILLALVLGSLQRSEGLMRVAVGQTRPDAPASYEAVHTGPLRDWRVVKRSFRVDEFNPNLRLGGIDRGPTPIVTVLDAGGQAVKTQRVYPNMPLQLGSLTIHPSGFGLVAGVARVSTSGVEAGRAYAFVDFSQTATEGTVPSTGFLVLYDAAGRAQLKVSITVPLDGTRGNFDEILPKKPAARIVVTGLDGTPLLDRLVSAGQNVALPIGGSLHLGYLGYYAELSVVDDISIPLLYLGLVVAMIGLTITVFTRQQLLLATVVDGPEGPMLAMSVRLWRNASTSRGEIESRLTEALGAGRAVGPPQS